MEMQPDQIFGSYASWKYDEHTWFITFMNGSQYIYLLEGERQALLIDTGYGFGHLRAYVEKLTDKPILVVNTHGHLDHVGGNGEFTRVHMLPGAVKDMETLEDGPLDLQKMPHPDYEKVMIADGFVFDLGGRQVEVIDIASHAHGSLALLDASHGLLFCGDEIESSQVLMYNMHAEAYDLREHLMRHRANMLKLRARSGEYHHLCPAHNGAPLATGYLDDYIALSEHLIDGTAAIEDKLNHPFIDASPLGPELCRGRWGRASFILRKSDVKALAQQN